MPVTLVGANIKGKPNFNVIAWFNLANHNPTLVSISSSKTHYTNKGIRENKTFSVNIPSTSLIEKVGYCGLNSGQKVDKSKVFNVFYGELKTAPMIRECPINIECKLLQVVKLPHCELMIGKIAEVYSEQKYLTGDRLDVKKIDPLIYEQGHYWKVGEYIAEAFDIGRNFKMQSE